jgi:hypothetical protein
VLGIGREQYTRRCRDCCFTETYPCRCTLKKRVIYVDQFHQQHDEGDNVSAKRTTRLLRTPSELCSSSRRLAESPHKRDRMIESSADVSQPIARIIKPKAVIRHDRKRRKHC